MIRKPPSQKAFTDGGGAIVGSVRMPTQSPDFVPFMQRIRDAKPDVAFLWIPSTQATGADEGHPGSAAARSRHPSDLGAGSAAGRAIAGNRRHRARPDHRGMYSTAGERPANTAFLTAWQRAYGDAVIPDFLSVNAWDGMAAIYELVKTTKGKFTADEAMTFLKGWKKPGQPARPDHDRPGYAGYRPERLYPAPR
jgi:branched-chain amino acid transport system substrate-binding protein